MKRKAVVSRRQVPGHQHAFSAWELTLSCGHKVTRTHSGKGATVQTADCWKCSLAVEPIE